MGMYSQHQVFVNENGSADLVILAVQGDNLILSRRDALANDFTLPGYESKEYEDEGSACVLGSETTSTAGLTATIAVGRFSQVLDGYSAEQIIACHFDQWQERKALAEREFLEASEAHAFARNTWAATDYPIPDQILECVSCNYRWNHLVREAAHIQGQCPKCGSTDFGGLTKADEERPGQFDDAIALLELNSISEWDLVSKRYVWRRKEVDTHPHR